MSACEPGACGGSGGDAPGEPLPSAAELERRAKALVERVNAKRLRDQQQLQQLRDGLLAAHERAVGRLEQAWYGQMQADSQTVRRQLEALYEVIGGVAEHEAEVQRAREDLNKLIAEMAGREEATQQ